MTLQQAKTILDEATYYLSLITNGGKRGEKAYTKLLEAIKTINK